MADLSLDALRSLVQDSLGKHLYENAIFFADKLVILSDSPDDVYRLVQAYLFTKQYRRALHVLTSRGLATAEARFRYITAKCYVECQEWDDCLATLSDEVLAAAKSAEAHGPSTAGQVSMYAAMQLLRGSVYEAQENWPLASRCYSAAVRHDPLCHEALHRLVANHMLSTGEQQELLAELEQKLVDADAEWLQVFYRCKLDPEQGRQLAEVCEEIEAHADEADGAEGAVEDGALSQLNESCDMLTAAAEYSYNHDHYRRCYKLSSKVLAKDPFHQQVLPVHICSMTRLNLHSELFYLAHQLEEEYPQLAVSWFAVGCYYLMIADFENARRYFSKATTIDMRFSPAWVGFGHAFAAQDESDQAMAAYRTASRLFPGSHIPWLGIGMEYLRTNHLHLALQYIRQAHQIAPHEPLVLHELGALHYFNGDYDEAIRFFLQVAQGSEDFDVQTREPSIFNLGHAYRKKRDFDSAIKWYREALAINPRLSCTYSALGFTHHLRGDLHIAIQLYHQSLSIKPDDTFTCEMLSEALKDSLDDPLNLSDLPSARPQGQGLGLSKGETPDKARAKGAGSSRATMMDM
ncbi:hypothetical protein AB1Y20_000297 [Prymnesium parvum]|uniref:Anaphase-promoting complex subunit 6 n=1 Tax=Prymnesium parvum TaxID=97485 RepID=A0AB34K7T0_PRYPA